MKVHYDFSRLRLSMLVESMFVLASDFAFNRIWSASEIDNKKKKYTKNKLSPFSFRYQCYRTNTLNQPNTKQLQNSFKFKSS